MHDQPGWSRPERDLSGILSAMVADDLPEVVLVGGPRDQWAFIKPAPLPDAIEMPLRIGMLALMEPDPIPCATYKRALVDGMPSIDDHGRHRYTYTGEGSG